MFEVDRHIAKTYSHHANKHLKTPQIEHLSSWQVLFLFQKFHSRRFAEKSTFGFPELLPNRKLGKGLSSKQLRYLAKMHTRKNAVFQKSPKTGCKNGSKNMLSRGTFSNSLKFLAKIGVRRKEIFRAVEFYPLQIPNQ